MLKAGMIGKYDTKMLIICLQKTHFVITIITVMLLAGAMVFVASHNIDFFPKYNFSKRIAFSKRINYCKLNYFSMPDRLAM
ncbi:hypothetical protein [Dickeya fangzhongdai]|uniref:hypothetical protein n=1 Tax=Dickeya fangzhongdai TaxID=1778540 RepID=UPI000B0A99E2|nr:hypothetical protein [Dickeya fangzhongdai]